MGAVCDDPAARPLNDRYGAAAVVEAVRAALNEARAQLLANPGTSASVAELLEAAARRLADRGRETMFPVINATGVVIHTNLGRAPLATEALAAMRAAAGYANLEMDLNTGRRSSRHEHLDRLIAEGAPVIVSRGELVEIGGGFRVPDVVAQSGSKLIEVGTTNRTHLRDYEQAYRDNPDARVILRTHPSNFRISGFTSSPPLDALAHFAHAHDLLLVEDLGGGALVDLSPFGIANEPTVQASLRAGVDLVLFSGDKLLGGPQAGIAAGRRALTDLMAAHPLARAMRLDKLSLAALAATLRLYLPPSDPIRRVPVLRMLTEDVAVLAARADALMAQVADAPELELQVLETLGYAGGGAMPMHALPGLAIALSSLRHSADELAHRLRTGPIRVLGRIENDQVLLDLRTVADDELPALAQAIRTAS